MCLTKKLPGMANTPPPEKIESGISKTKFQKINRKKGFGKNLGMIRQIVDQLHWTKG